MCHYFTRLASRLCSCFGLGEDETISKNKETINNPAIAAPINISNPSGSGRFLSTPDAIRLMFLSAVCGRSREEITAAPFQPGAGHPGRNREASGAQSTPRSCLEALVVRMARENSGWGYDRIVDALANLGHRVSDQTVGNILRRHGLAPYENQNASAARGLPESGRIRRARVRSCTARAGPLPARNTDPTAAPHRFHSMARPAATSAD
jgi:hypothetical protein